jgi:hypothetical protein
MAHMNGEEREAEMNRLRVELQRTTSCPETAAHIALVLAASFCLDECDRDPGRAAGYFRRLSESTRKDIVKGNFVLVRQQ